MSNPLWGTPPHKRPLRGAANVPPSPRGRINARDAGSIFSGAVITQAAVVPIAASLEAWAQYAQPGLPAGAAGLSSWAVGMAVWLVVRVIAAALSNYGESLVRDIGAWMWGLMFDSIKLPRLLPHGGDRRGLFRRLFFRRRRVS